MRTRLLLRRKGMTLALGWVCVVLMILVLSETHYLWTGRQPVRRTALVVAEEKNAIEARFERRRRRVMEVCGGHNISSHYQGVKYAHRRFIFPTNTSPVVLYCPIPKTGTTFLKKVFAEANKQEKVVWVDRFHVRPVYNYDKAIMFFFTREPYSRILSAYVDKLWSPNLHFWRALGRGVVTSIRPHPSPASLDCGHDVTFPEFIRYFIEGQMKDVHINTHIVPTHKFCEACRYNYDYIGKLETFREDVTYILSAINVSSSHNCSNDDDIITEHIKQVFYTLVMDKKHCEKKHNLLLRAWRSLQIRGLISLQMHFPFSVQHHVNRVTFSTAVRKAAQTSLLMWRDLDQSFATSSSRDAEPSQSASSSLSARSQQKRLVLASAYSLVPLADKVRLMELLREEFELFDYQPKLQEVFSPAFPHNQNIFNLSYI